MTDYFIYSMTCIVAEYKKYMHHYLQ